MILTEEDMEFWGETLFTYSDVLRNELMSRWQAWKLDLTKPEMYEVLGGLMARQVTLATQLAESPTVWNVHIAPIILRAMTDVHINFAWILEDPLDRAQKFILHGLGQEKLLLEHERSRIVESGQDPKQSPKIKYMQDWVDSQRYTFLLEVNVGSWSGLDVRTMADQAGCLDLYKFDYMPLSGAAHSMWQHIGKFNLEECANPIHRFHRVPSVSHGGIDPAYLLRGAQYVSMTFDRFDQKSGVSIDVPSALAYLDGRLDKVREKSDRINEEESPLIDLATSNESNE
jgi:hypothetical protein